MAKEFKYPKTESECDHFGRRVSNRKFYITCAECGKELGMVI